MFILLWVFVLSFVIIVSMIGMRFWAIKSGRHTITNQPALSVLIQSKVDYVALVFVMLCRETSKLLSLHTLVFLKKGISYCRIRIVRVEKKFSKVIDLVHGKNQPSNRGAVSFFLSEIKDHKDRLRIKSRA